MRPRQSQPDGVTSIRSRGWKNVPESRQEKKKKKTAMKGVNQAKRERCHTGKLVWERRAGEKDKLLLLLLLLRKSATVAESDFTSEDLFFDSRRPA